MKFDPKAYNKLKLSLYQSADTRLELAQQLYDHLADGYSIDCFARVSSKVLADLISKFPDEFDPDIINQAKEYGKDMWEKLGKSQADGSCIGNSRTWFYNMAHRYKWSDKLDINHDIKGSLNVNIVNYASPQPPQAL